MRESARPAAPLSTQAEAPRFVAERQQHIAEALRNLGRVEVAALATEFGVSEDTVRRDLRQLAARGLAHKTHGGAVAIHSAALPTRSRAALLPAAKAAIAQRALAEVQAHHTLFIDGGSTTLALVQALCAPGAPRPLAVITHALDAALLLADAAQAGELTLVLAGGLWQPEPRIFTGPQAEATLRAHRADIAFLGACALHPRAGLTATLPAEAPIKRAMVEGAARRIVLSDASKLGQVAPCAVASADEVDLVISNGTAPWLGERLVAA